MFDSILEVVAEYPYIGLAVVFLLCGMGLPLPEEIALLAAGYVCHAFPDKARLGLMMAWCAGAILAGDLIPYVLGRVFGTRLLRIRWLRIMVTRRRLAKFDRWFRRRGDLVIFVARFLAGIRMVAFFTAGTMKMPLPRFLLLDGLGIALLVPTLVFLGWSSAGMIDRVAAWVVRVERGILWSTLAGLAVLGVWYWIVRSRRAALARRVAPAEAFVEPRVPPSGTVDAGDPETGDSGV